MEYSNPLMSKTVDNWPSGRHRVQATFTIETHPTRGERAVRTTRKPITGRPSQPKMLTYARRVRIVDGDDGRTYLLEDTGNHLSVMQGNMQLQQETIFPGDARYADVRALFDTQTTQTTQTTPEPQETPMPTATATYDPHSDVLTYHLGAGAQDPDFARAARLGAAGFTVHQTKHGTHYTAPWSPDAQALLTDLAGVIGDAHPQLVDGLTWDQGATRWHDPAYWQARAMRAVAQGCAVTGEEGLVRHADLTRMAASMETVATQALARQRQWEGILPSKGQEDHAGFRRRVTDLLETTAEQGRLQAQLQDEQCAPIEIAAALITQAAQHYRFAKTWGCHLRKRIAYFQTMQRPNEGVAVDPAVAVLLDAAQLTAHDSLKVLGFEATAGTALVANTLHARGVDPTHYDVVCLRAPTDGEAEAILQALDLVKDGGRLLVVCSPDFETALTPAWLTVQGLSDYLDVTVTLLEDGRLLLQIVN